MTTFDYDLRYVQAGVEQLEAYLLSPELYWPSGVSARSGETPYPQLTLSNLLLALRRLQATAQTPGQKEELSRLEQQLEANRYRWRSAWRKKAQVDFHARLRLWRDFLEEYRQKPSAHYDRYTYEVGRRVQLHLLESEIPDLKAAEKEAVQGLDKLLRAFFVPGEFVWDAALKSSFPPETFWYLYGHLRVEVSGG